MPRITLTLEEGTIEQLVKLAGGPRRISLWLTGVVKDLDAGRILKRVDRQEEMAKIRNAQEELERLLKENRKLQRELHEESA